MHTAFPTLVSLLSAWHDWLAHCMPCSLLLPRQYMPCIYRCCPRSLCGINQLLAYLVSSAALLRNTSVYMSALTGSGRNLFSLPSLLPSYDLDYMAAVVAALLTLLACMSTRAFDNSNKGRQAGCTDLALAFFPGLNKMLSRAAAALHSDPGAAMLDSV